eukprot:TRINITY_DN22523_c0_g1_i1.p1 TRINITY_DN22523_c0_g1~~TRINITY_DN22523_c0_g1_i1.p1  ORF type:complete len:162 (-),score=22.85 TRINITY_DN22523_c0_g1_i1:71-556(-)
MGSKTCFFVVLVVVCLLSGVAQTRNITEKDCLSLIYSYADSQNNRDLNIIGQIFAQNSTATAPIGSSVAVGLSNITAFYTSFFKVATSITETITSPIIVNVGPTGAYASYSKLFNAQTYQGCVLEVPVITWFQFTTQSPFQISSFNAIWNTTLFTQQFSCH